MGLSWRKTKGKILQHSQRPEKKRKKTNGKWQKLRWLRLKARGNPSVWQAKFCKNLETIQSKLTNSITSKEKCQIWEEITIDLNVVGKTNCTEQEVLDKRKNIQSTAKEEFSSFKREIMKTGGRPKPKPPLQSSKQIIEILEDTPVFAGWQGFKSGND